MAIDAAIAFGVGETAAAGAADFAAMGALGDFSAMTLTDIALPGAVADAAAGTLAYAVPETLAAEGAAFGTAAGQAGSSLGEGSLLGPGFSSASELGVGTGGTPIATGAEALSGGGSASGTLAGSSAGAPLGGGATSAVGSIAPAGTLSSETLATTPFSTDLAAGGPAQLGGETSLASQSVLQPSQIAQQVGTSLGEGSSGLTQAEITSGAAQGGSVASQAGTQDVMAQLGVQPAGVTPPPTGQLAQLTSQTTMSDATTPEMEAAARGGGQVASTPTTTTMSTSATTPNAVAQAPTAYNPEGAVPQIAQQAGVPSTAPAIPTAPAPAAAPPVGTSVGEGASGVTQAEIAAGKGAGATAIGNAGAEGFGTQAMNYLAKNPSMLLSGAGLLGNLLMGQQQQPKFQNQLSAEAQYMQAQGQQLASYLASGNLPPGVQAQLNSAHEAAIASIRSQHARQGTSGSSMEAQDLQRINEAVVSQGASIATQLLQAGISEQQMAVGIYNNLMNASLAQDQRMSQAISGFTNALAYGAARPVG